MGGVGGQKTGPTKLSETSLVKGFEIPLAFRDRHCLSHSSIVSLRNKSLVTQTLQHKFKTHQSPLLPHYINDETSQRLNFFFRSGDQRLKKNIFVKRNNSTCFTHILKCDFITNPEVNLRKLRSPITMANSTAVDTCKLYQRSPPTWPASISAFHAGLNIFLSIATSLGNVLILVALHKASSIHPPTKLLFRCLAVTDLCVGFTVQPLHVIVIMDHIISINCTIIFYAHKVKETFAVVLCGLSIALSTAISVDRLLALMLGLGYRHVVTLRRVRAVVIIFLLVSISVGFIRFFWSSYISYNASVAMVILCLVISVVSYAKIFLRLWQHQVHVQDHVHDQAQSNGGGIPLNIARYKKTVSNIAWVQLALVACYTPFGTVVMLGAPSRMVILSAVTLVLLNSFLNPFLYCWKIREVRQEVKNTVKQFCCETG